MMRAALYSVAVLGIFAASLVADDKKGDQTKANRVRATFVKADIAKNMLTFKTSDKAGKTTEMTLPLAKDAKILATNDKPESFADFAKNLQAEKDKTILVVEDKEGKWIVQLKDHPTSDVFHLFQK